MLYYGEETYIAGLEIHTFPPQKIIIHNFIHIKILWKSGKQDYI